MTQEEQAMQQLAQFYPEFKKELKSYSKNDLIKLVYYYVVQNQALKIQLDSKPQTPETSVP